MKKLLLLTFVFCLSTLTFSQEYGWVDISANLPKSANLNDIHVIGNEIWITGGNAEVFYSPDGGETFQIQTLPENSGISSSVFMKNNKLGYVVTYSGKILKTENGGTNWAMLHEPGGTLNSVHFPPSSSTGYTCGENGKVYSFSNTASDITDISPVGIVSSLQSITFPIDTSEGKLCGQNIIRRYLSGSWENLQFFDNGFLYFSIYFTDNSTGWVVGSQGKIFNTIDGLSWLAQTSNTTKTLNNVFFINSHLGWTAGTEVLLHTDDGGETWTQELANQTVGKELRAIYFTSANNGYVVGNGTLLKYTEIAMGVGQELETTKFKIYPNPTAGNFRVQCSELCPTTGGFKVENATIEFYDLTGKKLLEKQISAGIENVEIDVSHLKNGVYFCRLVLDKESVTKKLIIRK